MSKDEPTPRKQPAKERRTMARSPSKGSTTIIRQSDQMRLGIDAKLHNVSTVGIGVLMDEPLDVNEQVKVVLRNEIQRFEKETRGTVKHVTPQDDGGYLAGIELLVRLTPLDVSMLKMGLGRS